MWQRFTERSRQVIFFAQAEAARRGDPEVSTEHMLLGVVREEAHVAARILKKMSIPVGQIRSKLERQTAHGGEGSGEGMPLNLFATRVIDLAYEEANRLNNNYIGTEHLLLGLLREEEGDAGRILAEFGVDLTKTRAEVQTLQANDSGDVPPEKTKGEAVPRSPADVQAGKEKITVTNALAVRAESVLNALIQTDRARWRGRSLVTLFDVSPEHIRAVLDTAASFKALKKQNKLVYFSRARTLALVFEKPSLRTRVSFEAGMAHLGGHSVYLAPADVGLGVRESVADVAGGLSRWVDVIAARTFKHETVAELAARATVPVINALSDREHPLQAFADLLTILETKGNLGNHLKLAYVGDGNNVLHALLLACAKVGVNLTAACPKGYMPALAYVVEAQRIGAGEAGTGARIEIVTDPIEAVKDADVVYTDVWTSMGQEEDKAERLALFAPYQVNSALLAHAKSDVVVLHCLPAHREEEITTEVMESYKTILLDQAENRLHTQKALVALMLGV